MKKIFYIVILMFGFVLNGCSDFLDSKPLSFTSINNFYQNENDAQTALIGLYGLVGNSYAVDYRTGLFCIADMGNDELVGNPYTTPDAASNMEQFIYGRVLKSNKNIRDLWAQMYHGIYSINLLLTQLPGIDMDDDVKTKIEAEARFLRGWHYMYMGMIWGGVPVYTTLPQDNKARNSLQEVMTQAISDFQFAYDKLPGDKIKTPGKASKWAAAGYLVKLYSYLASCKKYGVGKNLNFALNSFDWVDVDTYYKNALALSNEIINDSGQTLTSDYRSLFCEGSTSEQSKELLFTLLPSPSKLMGMGLTYYLLPVGNNGGGWGTCRPTQEQYDRYDTLYDSRVHWVVGGLCNTETATETIDGHAYYIPAALHLSNGQAYDGDYCINKYRYVKTSSKHEDSYYGYFPLLRLADIYLYRAEAKAHLEGDEAGREALKEVRYRALMKNRTTDVSLLQSKYRRKDFVQELLDERSRELCYEQQRKFDLIRFNRYESTIKSISTTYGVWNRNAAPQLIDNITDQKIWSPIPEEDELANPLLLPNNPNY
jgi:hypothetical protein